MNWFEAASTFEVDPWLHDWIRDEHVKANYPHGRHLRIPLDQQERMLKKLITRRVRFIVFWPYERLDLNRTSSVESLNDERSVTKWRKLTVFYHLGNEPWFSRQREVRVERSWEKEDLTVTEVIDSIGEQHADADLDAVVEHERLSWTYGETDETFVVYTQHGAAHLFAELPRELAIFVHRLQQRRQESVGLLCWNSSCDDTPIPAVVTAEVLVNDSKFSGHGRIHWDPNKSVTLSYRLKEEVHCPKCQARIESALIVWQDHKILTVGGQEIE